MQKFKISTKRHERHERIRKARKMRTEGLTYAEIGENLKICISTARNWTLGYKKGKIVI